MPQKIILFTLSNGKQCRSVIPFVLKDPGFRVRAFVHSHESAAKITSDFDHPTNFETVVGDLLNRDDIINAMENVHTVFHVGPPMSVHEPHIGVMVIQAAEKAGVEHFIFSSVLHPIRSKLLNHDVKRQVEEYLIESTLNWTVLQPTHFMQNTNPAEAVRTGILPVAYNSDSEMGFIDLRDLGQVALNILENPSKHYRARYELCGENVSYKAYADLISQVSDKSVRVNKVDGRTVAQMSAKGDRDFEDRLSRMFFYYDRWGLVGNSNVLEWILGRPYRSLECYIKDSLAGEV